MWIPFDLLVVGRLSTFANTTLAFPILVDLFSPYRRFIKIPTWSQETSQTTNYLPCSSIWFLYIPPTATTSLSCTVSTILPLLQSTWLHACDLEKSSHSVSIWQLNLQDTHAFRFVIIEGILSQTPWPIRTKYGTAGTEIYGNAPPNYKTP